MKTRSDGWKRCLLGEVINLKRGYDLPSHQRQEGTVPIVSSAGVTGYHIESKVKGPGVVTGRYGTLGEVFFIRDDFWPLNTALYIQDFKGNDERFISYFLKTLNFGRKNVAGAVPGVNRNDLHMVPVILPSPKEQKEIAGILSAYDDLIENNTRRIRILEEMAQAIYREWFVEFHAPGVRLRKATPQEKALTGKDRFPEGWEIKKIQDAFETLGGGTPSTKEVAYWQDGEINWFSPTDLTSADAMFIGPSEKKITRLGLEKSAAKLFPPYSVMMTSRATIGVVSINTTEACTNQGFITCIPNDRVSAFHIYFWILENKEKIIALASGATFKEISRGEFRDFDFILPSKAVEAQFIDMVEPMAKEIETLLHSITNLRQTRDLLLPHLIKG